MFVQFKEVEIESGFTFYIFNRGIVEFVKIDSRQAVDSDGIVYEFFGNDLVFINK